MKTCKTCKQALPLSEYWKQPKNAGGLSHNCKACHRAYAKQHARKHRATEKGRLKYRNWVLKRNYGIDVEAYDLMLWMQDGACRICKSVKPGGRWGKFHVDHCHTTGRVRGLLCSRCNVAVGLLADCTDNLARATDYLNASRGYDLRVD